MSSCLNNIFNFGRSLPAPFDSLPNKKVAVASKYSGGGTQATLVGSVLKAINAVCACLNGSGEGAVGKIDHRSVAEYKSSNSATEYHIVVYDSTNGNLTGSVYDSNTENIEVYVVNPKARDGAALFMAMFPTLMEDDEFEEYFGKYRDAYDSGFTDMTQAIEYAGYLCDNVYRRIKDETSHANVKVNLDAAGNLMRISHTHLDSGTYAPKEVVAGEFTIFAKLGKPKTVGKAKKVIAQADFVGKFTLSARKLNVQESLLVPKLPEWYIVPEEVLDICKHAQGTTGRPMQMRNFLLRGPAGTGKTMGAKAIAAGLGLPYMKYTCSAGTEIYDFIGQIFPDSESKSGNSELDKEREQLKKMGGITYANVSKLMGLPDLEDMDYDPAGVYQMLTGVENLSATSQDCMSVVMERVTEKVKALSKQNESDGNKGQSFSYIETDFIKALKYGYVVEIQEPTTIMQPGVLVGLNSLLEQEGSITLPTGEIIQRHPDAVVVVTTNVSYEGCRGMNQSIIDRMSLLRDIELPSQEVMAERAMSVTGETDEYKVSQMVQVIIDMADYCRKNSISDGNVGMRGLIDWILSSNITGDVYTSALYTVISKATSDEADREALISCVLEPIFAPKRSRAI